MSRMDIGVLSGTVMTVGGPIPVHDLGVTMMHEHIVVDVISWWHCPDCAERMFLTDQPVQMSILGELRMDPFVNRDNCSLTDVDISVAELQQYADLGGRTVVDPTNNGIGRSPATLREISDKTGLNIVMGAGYYLEASQPADFAGMSEQAIADEIEREATEGADGTGVRIGIIGEIGVGKDFTPAEEKSLRGAARAQAATGLPLSIHLPGWERLAHRVLDVVAEEGGDLAHTVLCHMNPSGADVDYQTSLAARGAFIEYDMIGMDYYYADQHAQSPCDEKNASAVKGLIDAGFGHSILLSQDVFLKMMLTHYGGFGYAHVLRHFVPRLRRHGVSDAQIETLLVDNPRCVFSATHRRQAMGGSDA